MFLIWMCFQGSARIGFQINLIGQHNWLDIFRRKSCFAPTDSKSQTRMPLSIEFLFHTSELETNCFPSLINSSAWTCPKGPLYWATTLAGIDQKVGYEIILIGLNIPTGNARLISTGQEHTVLMWVKLHSCDKLLVLVCLSLVSNCGSEITWIVFPVSTSVRTTSLSYPPERIFVPSQFHCKSFTAPKSIKRSTS